MNTSIDHHFVKCAYDIGQTSTAIFLSRQSSMSFGCLTSENLPSIHQTSPLFGSRRYSPMPDPLGAQQDGVVQVHVRVCAVPEGLSRMEKERDVDTELFLPGHEPGERFEIVDEGFERVLRPNEIESCVSNSEISVMKDISKRQRNAPASKCGNSCLRVKQSSVYHSSSSGVIFLKVE